MTNTRLDDWDGTKAGLRKLPEAAILKLMNNSRVGSKPYILGQQELDRRANSSSLRIQRATLWLVIAALIVSTVSLWVATR